MSRFREFRDFRFTDIERKREKEEQSYTHIHISPNSCDLNELKLYDKNRKTDIYDLFFNSQLKSYMISKKYIKNQEITGAGFNFINKFREGKTNNIFFSRMFNKIYDDYNYFLKFELLEFKIKSISEALNDENLRSKEYDRVLDSQINQIKERRNKTLEILKEEYSKFDEIKMSKYYFEENNKSF